MNLDVLLPTTIGIFLLALGAHNEFQWRRRFWNHQTLTGRVIELHADEDGDCYPEIEYKFCGQTKRFRSCYSIMPTPFIGAPVQVVTDSDGQNAEYLTNKTRWYFTAIPIVSGLVALAIALLNLI